MFSSTLALALVNPFPYERGPFQNPELCRRSRRKSREQENTIYLRDDAPAGVLAPAASEHENYEKARQNGAEMKNSGYLPLVTKFNEPAPGFGRNTFEQTEGLWSTGATPIKPRRAQIGKSCPWALRVDWQ